MGNIFFSAIAIILYSRPPYTAPMRKFPYNEFTQRNIVVLVCTESHALAVKSNLGKIWRNRNFKTFNRKLSPVGGK